MFIEVYKLTGDKKNMGRYLNTDHILYIAPDEFQPLYSTTIYFINGKQCRSKKGIKEIREVLRECGMEVW